MDIRLFSSVVHHWFSLGTSIYRWRLLTENTLKYAFFKSPFNSFISHGHRKLKPPANTIQRTSRHYPSMSAPISKSRCFSPQLWLLFKAQCIWQGLFSWLFDLWCFGGYSQAFNPIHRSSFLKKMQGEIATFFM